MCESYIPDAQASMTHMFQGVLRPLHYKYPYRWQGTEMDPQPQATTDDHPTASQQNRQFSPTGCPHMQHGLEKPSSQLSLQTGLQGEFSAT